MNESEAAGIARELVRTYPTIKWDADTLLPYLERMQGLPFDVGRFAMAYMCEAVTIPSVAVFLDQVEVVKRDMMLEPAHDVPTMRIGPGARADAHEGRLKLIRARRSPADDPDWGDLADHPYVDFGPWLAQQPEHVRRRVARMAPALAGRYGVTLDEPQPDPSDKQRATERARALKRGGWA